jgi:organic hydroperoxide reductase OsmC/OhrA
MATKTAFKSFRYKANTAWSFTRRGTLSASGKPNINVGSPPEFKGEPDVWAPEELLVGSVNTCMMLTFLTLAQAKGLTPVRYESEAEGLLENIEGKYRITEVMIRPRVSLLRTLANARRSLSQCSFRIQSRWAEPTDRCQLLALM